MGVESCREVACGAEGVDTAGQRRNVNAVGSQSEPGPENSEVF